jgi:putative acetyltransferase
MASGALRSNKSSSSSLGEGDRSAKLSGGGAGRGGNPLHHPSDGPPPPGKLGEDFTFHEGDLESADVQALLDFHFAQMRETSPPEVCHVLPLNGLRNAAVTFWSARDGGTLVGVGALKELAPGHGEIKSMRTAPAALGRGVGRAILNHIVAAAKMRGYRRLSLETGSTEPFAAALRLYASEGFVPCGPFGDYQDTPFTRFFTREL